MNASSGKDHLKRSLRIADRLVGDEHPCFIIAEVGNNHNGDFDRAIALVDAAVAAGADCAKFQMRKLDEVYRASSLSGKGDDLAVEYTLDLLRRFELTTEQQRRVAAYCVSKNIQYLCTPWDASSVAALDSIETKYRDHGATVTFTGLDQRSSSFHQRLSGQLGILGFQCRHRGANPSGGREQFASLGR